MNLRRLRDLPARRPGAILALCLGLTAALASAAPFTRWDANPELLTLEGSPELRTYREYLSRFGSDELIVIAWTDPELLEPPGLARVRTVTDALLALPDVVDVVSLDTAYRIDVGPFGPFTRPLVPDDLGGAPEPRALRDAVAGLPIAQGLLDAAGTTTTVTVRPAGASLDAESRAAQRRVLVGIDAALRRPELAGLEFHLAGSPVFNRELERLNSRDNAFFTPLTLGTVSVLLFFSLGDLVSAGLALACVLGTLAWVRGAMTLLDVPLNTTTSLLPPIVMVLSVSVSVHVLSRYARERALRSDARAAVAATERAVLVPAALTALTTMIGFGSLGTSPIESIRSFGAFAALGVAVSFGLGGIAVPAALRLLEPPGRLPRAGRALERAVGFLWHLSRGHGRAVLATAAGITLLAASALPMLRVSTHDSEFFRPDHPLNRAYRFIESRLAGVTPLEVMVEARETGGIRTPEALAALRRIQDFLAGEPETVRGVSIADLVDLARDAIEPTGERAAPLSPGGVERAAFVLEAVSGRDLPYWVQDGWTRARISSRAVGLDSRHNDALLARLERFLAEVEDESPLRLAATGLVPVFARMEEYLLRSQIQSFGSALVLIAGVFFVLFRSLRVTAVALVVNVIPIVLTLGVMGAAGIPLDVVTVMVASVNLGIVVDDTIHLLHCVKRDVAAGVPLEQAMDAAVAKVGRAVVQTAIVLTLGFGILVFSDFRPTARFGGLTVLTFVSGLAVELILLPALVRRLRAFPAPVTRLSLEEAA